MKQRTEIEEKMINEDYERFCKFWEKARNIVDEDGDNFLKWDKSNMCHVSFTEGYELGFKQGIQKAIGEFQSRFNMRTETLSLKEFEESKEKLNQELKEK